MIKIYAQSLIESVSGRRTCHRPRVAGIRPGGGVGKGAEQVSGEEMRAFSWNAAQFIELPVGHPRIALSTGIASD